MERYHSTAGDPPRRDADVKRQEAQELDELVQQFLAGGGQIEKVGYKMRELPDTFVINPMKTPVYNGALAENSSLKAKPAAPRAQAKTEPQRSPAPVPALQPAPGVNPKVWLSRMIAAQALLARRDGQARSRTGRQRCRAAPAGSSAWHGGVPWHSLGGCSARSTSLVSSSACRTMSIGRSCR
ncbi:hypothetical protein HUS13_27340 [Pseudomonas aeruginosa]|uniref:hypothetical protein n=1 Tax=Pseudomonas aeruginosa TaxID=287 RepID=UPI0019207A1D|nr:hypothetical protein [Pseudomonas aeruginosa]QQW18153.1 hypothetical protein HUS13_27340 [Pseudomonas aeruginosa]